MSGDVCRTFPGLLFKAHDMSDAGTASYSPVGHGTDGTVYVQAEDKKLYAITERCCNATNISHVSAQWVYKQTVGIPTDVSFQVGVQHTSGVSNSLQWGASVTKSVQAGFSFLGLGASTTVTGTTALSIGAQFSQVFGESATVTETMHFSPGVVWQFRFNVTNECGSSSLVFTPQLEQTLNRPSVPCCLPGYFADPKNASGACAGIAGKLFNLCRL
jgi:hypothetical protein